jgi:hypothetical protein
MKRNKIDKIQQSPRGITSPPGLVPRGGFLFAGPQRESEEARQQHHPIWHHKSISSAVLEAFLDHS